MKVLLGGGPNEELGGLFYKPTLISNPPKDSEIVTSEIFGPVLTMQTFATDEEVIEIANATEFGLAAVIVSGDRKEHAKAVASQSCCGYYLGQLLLCS
jgi:aminomuconate-semialdehyde/2-hydroxymuconate-6-semialdehyde dehydrogenase